MVATPSVLSPEAPNAWHCPKGALVRARGQVLEQVLHLRAGRIASGLWEQGQLLSRLAVFEAPFWLDIGDALLGKVPLLDLVAETPLDLERVPLADLSRRMGGLPESARELVQDLARSHREQAESTLNRLLGDAEARCAAWLLRHAQLQADGELLVALQTRKRQIAAQLGMAPETFSRTLRQLRERKLVYGTGRLLTLAKPSELRTLAGV